MFRVCGKAWSTWRVSLVVASTQKVSIRKGWIEYPLIAKKLTYNSNFPAATKLYFVEVIQYQHLIRSSIDGRSDDKILFAFWRTIRKIKKGCRYEDKVWTCIRWDTYVPIVWATPNVLPHRHFHVSSRVVSTTTPVMMTVQTVSKDSRGDVMNETVGTTNVFEWRVGCRCSDW